MNNYLHVSVAEDRLGLKYPGFSVVFMQTFAIDHSLNFKLPSAEEATEKAAASIIRRLPLDIERQIFVLPEGAEAEEHVSRFSLEGFNFTMPMEPTEDDDFYPVTLSGHVDVEMNVFFGNTISINYYFLFNNDGSHCSCSSPVNTDHIIALLSTFLSAEHWSKLKENQEKTDINFESEFRIDEFWLDEYGHPCAEAVKMNLSGKGRMFDGVAVLYKKFIYEHCTCYNTEIEAPEKAYRKYRRSHPYTVNNDYHYAMVDLWEDIQHPTPDGDIFSNDYEDRMTEVEIIRHVRYQHMEELIGLLSLYPGEWFYRDPEAFDEVCGRNIAIDTDDLVLAGNNLCMVLGTYGKRNGSGQGVDWKDHLKERAYYHVSWPEYLMILQVVIAKKYTIALANDALVNATINKKRMTAESLIGENALLSMSLSRMLLQLDVVKYSKFPAHKVMFDRTVRRFGLDDDLSNFYKIMNFVDGSLHNLKDYKSMKTDFILNIILAIISCASTFELFFQQSEMPFLSYFGIETNRLSVVVLSIVACITIFGILLVIKNSIMSIYEKIREND